jgi:hypothetical protein
MTSIESKSIPCKDWLAGLIDAGGCFLISAKAYASLEITVGPFDFPMLQKIETQYGGSLKARAGSKSVRYRLRKKANLLNLVKDVNGRIRNSIRLDQFRRLCDLFDIPLIFPEYYSWNSAYCSGLFDGDGKIVLSVKANRAQKNLKGTRGKIKRLSSATKVQLSLGITQKDRKNIRFLLQPWNLESFGFLNCDKSKNDYYTWYVSSRRDVFKMLDYFERYPCYSVRGHRIAQIKSFYSLIDAGDFRKKSKAWEDFSTNWFKYMS